MQPTDRQKFVAMRKRLGLSQYQLAVELGYSPAGIAAIEQSTHPTRRIHLLALECLLKRAEIEK